jgi:hypothetical protein
MQISFASVGSGANRATVSRTLRWLRFICSVLLMGLLAACASVKLVPDYDAEAAKGITDTAAEVFAFYDKLIGAKAKGGTAELPYAGFAEEWGKIDTRVRVLLVREESRPLNSESQRIARTILEFWGKYRAKHQENDDYGAKLAAIHRDRFQRLFTAALAADKAKALATEGSDAKKE